MHATCFGHLWPSSGIKVDNLKPKWTCVKNILQFVKSHTPYNCQRIGLIHIFCSLLMHECAVGFNEIVLSDGNIKIDCWSVVAQRDEFHHNDQSCSSLWVCISHTRHFWTNVTLAPSTEHEEHKTSRQYDFFLCYSSFPFSFLTFNITTTRDIKQL